MARRKKEVLQVEQFPIASKTIEILKSAGIHCATDFSNVTIEQIRALPGLGAVRLTELRLFLKDAKIKLKRELKPRKEPKYDVRTRELVKKLFNNRVNSWVVEMQCAGKLINFYGYETIERLVMPPGVDSLRYFFSAGQISGWVDKFMQQFAPVKLIEREKPKEPEKKEETKIEGITYVPPDRKTPPKSLSDFLKSRR